MSWRKSRTGPLGRAEIRDTWKRDWEVPKEFYCSGRGVRKLKMWDLKSLFYFRNLGKCVLEVSLHSE